MAVQKGGSNGKEIRMARVVDLDNTPRVLASANLATTDLNNVLRTDNGKRHQSTKLSVLLHGVFVILINIVRKVVHGNSVVLDILHDELLGFGKLSGCERIGTADDGNNVDTWCETLHQLDIELSEAELH